jgi:hypothetical protein
MHIIHLEAVRDNQPLINMTLRRFTYLQTSNMPKMKGKTFDQHVDRVILLAQRYLAKNLCPDNSCEIFNELAEIVDTI